MATNANTQIVDGLTEHSLDLLRLTGNEQNTVRGILEELAKNLNAQLQDINLSTAKATRIRAVLASIQSAINDTYENIAELHATQLGDAMLLEAQVVSGIVNAAVGVDIMDSVLPASVVKNLVARMMVFGAPSSAYWERQGQDLAFRFAAQVRLGMTAGETTQSIVQRIVKSGIYDIAVRNAEALVRTSIQTAANYARMNAYQANSDVIAGVQQVSTLDDRTTEVCIAYDGQAWTLSGEPFDKNTTLPFDNGPPRHWGCRSILAPITKSWKDLGIDVDELDKQGRASADGALAETQTFDQWLATKSKAKQDEILGTGKATLWRDGKITLQQLLDQRGRPLTLGELRSKHSA